MAAHLVRLKLTLLRNQLRGSAGQAVGLLLSMAFGLLAAGLLIAGAVALRGVPADDAGVWVTALGAAAIVGWVVAPLGTIGGDQTLDPLRFVTFAVPRRQLVSGLLAGSLVSVPAAVTAVAALGTVVVWSRDPVTAVVAVPSGLIGLLTCLLASRAAGTALAVLQAGRRFREVAVSIGLVLVGSLSFLPLVLTESAVALSVDALRPVVEVLALTPLGWAWSAPGDAAHGDLLVAALKLVLAGALLPVLMRSWGALLERHLVRPPVSGRATARERRGLLAVVPGLAGAVAQRCLRYWRRDPRYTLNVVMYVGFPLLGLVLVAIGWMSLQGWALGVAPAVAFLVGWGLHNDLAYDADPWWLHLAAHVPGRADRAGPGARVRGARGAARPDRGGGRWPARRTARSRPCLGRRGGGGARRGVRGLLGLCCHRSLLGTRAR